MTRYIDADKLIEDVDGDLTDSIAEGRAIEKIMNAPTVDAVPVRHGKWIHKWSGCGSTWLEQKCSVCGVVFEDEPNDYSYCPNCGADMREEE